VLHNENFVEVVDGEVAECYGSLSFESGHGT
jgi:hypothetical protein